MATQAAPASRWQRAAPWLGVGMLSLAALISVWRLQHAAPPANADWRVVAAAVAAQWQPGDVVVAAPSWTSPIARRFIAAMGDVDAATKMDLAAVSRAFVVTPTRDRHLARPLLLASGFTAGSPAHTQTIGALTLARFEQQPVAVIDNLLAHQASTIAEVGEVAHAGYAPKRCVQLVPPPGGQSEILVDMTLGTTLVGYVGLADVFTRRNVRTEGHLRIEQVAADGARIVLAQQVVGVDDGWVRFAATTKPGMARLAFVASSPARDGRDRRLCFAAEARP
ncbi:MAG: hypothetical protein IPL79_00555 [Myxococcales bacterium]|nr:hypothetical protein [Myxococcales bacterium]